MQSEWNRQARASGGCRPERFNLPHLTADDLEILKQEALIRKEFGEEGVRRFWESIPAAEPTYSAASEPDADEFDAEFRKTQKKD